MRPTFEPIIGADFPKKVIPLLDSAKKNIDIAVYDWRWYANQPAHAVQQFNIALVRAVQRGVLVRAVVNTTEIVPQLKKVGIQARGLKDARTLHTKLILIDGELAIIGSHNFTRNAFGSNIEVSLAVGIPVEHDRLAQFFNNIF